MVYRGIGFLTILLFAVLIIGLVAGCSASGGSPVSPGGDGSDFPGNQYDYLYGTDMQPPWNFVFQDDSYVPSDEPMYREAEVNRDDEPNNSCDEAVEIVIGATPDDRSSGSINWPKVYEGSLDPIADPSDFYRFNLDQTALGVQLSDADEETILRLWMLNPNSGNWSMAAERTPVGMPKAINGVGMPFGDYCVEITNTTAPTGYTLRVAKGTNNDDEGYNDHCDSLTPPAGDWERGTLEYGSGGDHVDYWRLDAPYGGVYLLNMIYFKDFDKSVIEMIPSLRDNFSPEPIEPENGFEEDGNNTYAFYGTATEPIAKGKYYTGAVVNAGEGLYYFTPALYAGSHWHKLFPEPVKLLACPSDISGAAKVVFTNRGNVPVRWYLESVSGRLTFDTDHGYLGDGYSTERVITLVDPYDPYWTMGVHPEEVTFKMHKWPSNELMVSYTIPVNVNIVEYEYTAECEPMPVVFEGIIPDEPYNEEIAVITNTGCCDFFCTLEPGLSCPWLSFPEPPDYLAPGHSTQVPFVVDSSGMYSNASGSATLKLFDMSMVEMASYEIQVQVNIDYVNPHPWPMEGGDRKHSSTSIFTGPTAGPEVIWSSREFGDWDGENISTKDIQTPITIDSSNRLYFSSKVKPITERCHNGYQYATLAVDGDSGELIAVIPYKGDGSSIAIDPDGSCWFAFESDTGAEFWRADVSGNTFVEACGIDMHDAVEGGPVINMHGSDPVAFIGSSGDRCSGYMFGMTGTGANVWNAGLAYVEHGVYSTPAVGDNGIVYFGDTSGGHGNGNVYGFRYNLADPGMDPHLYKSSVIGGVGVGPTIDAQGRVYVIDDDEKLYRFSPDLAEMEILNTDARDRWGPVVSTSGILYFETGNGLCAYDVSGDGDPVGMWVFDYSRCSGEGEYAHAAPLIDAWGNAYIGTKNKWVFGIDQNGGEMWSIRVNGSITGTPALGANGWLYIGDDKGYVYAIG